MCDDTKRDYTSCKISLEYKTIKLGDTSNTHCGLSIHFTLFKTVNYIDITELPHSGVPTLPSELIGAPVCGNSVMYVEFTISNNVKMYAYGRS